MRGLRLHLHRRHACSAVALLLFSSAALGSVFGYTAAKFTATAANSSNSFAAASTFLTYPQTVVADSPTVYYRLDDALNSMTAADSSGNGTTGTFAGAIPSYQAAGSPAGGSGGGADTAARFPGEGTSKAYATASLTNPTPMSEEIWFKTTSTAGSRFFTFSGSQTSNAGNTDREIRMATDGKLSFMVYPGTTKTITSAAAYNDGSWHQAISTLGASGQRLYVDGVLRASDATVTSAQNFTGYWRLGGFSTYFDGTLDEASVYLSELSAARVLAHYNAGIGASALSDYTTVATADSPWALWHLDDGYSGPFTSATVPTQAMADSSGNAHGGFFTLRPYSVVTGGSGALTGTGAASTSAAITAPGIGYDPVSGSGPTTFSLELWFRTTTTTGGALLSFGNTANGSSGSHDRYIYMRNNGTLSFGYYSGSPVVVTSAAAYNNGTWHYVVGTCGASGLSLYVDNVRVGYNASPAGSPGVYSGYWRWGGDNLGNASGRPTSDMFNGDLDEIAIYPTELSAQQVSWHYHANH